MVLYSDGCLEVRNANQELFGLRRFENLLHGHRNQPAGEMLSAVSEAVMTFSGQEGACEDDYSLLSLEISRHGKPAMPSDCLAKERLCAYGLMSPSEFKSSSQVSIWPLGANEKAFFVLRIGDYNLLGVFLSFLIELEFHHDACPFIEFDTEQRAGLAPPALVTKFLSNWLRRHRSEADAFEMLYGILDVTTGKVQLNLASMAPAESVIEPALVNRKHDQPIVIALAEQDDLSLRIGFDLDSTSKHCGLSLGWRDGSTVVPATVPLNDRVLLNKAMGLADFFGTQ